MLAEKMYVRCPVDPESVTDPRIFIMGQVTNVDLFANTVKVIFRDPFNYFQYYDSFPHGEVEFPIQSIERCNFFNNSVVLYKRERYEVLANVPHKDDFYEYYIRSIKTRTIILASEKDIIAPFNIGHVNPCKQLQRYEFQNPVWYMGRAVVDQNMQILDNSMFGFKELAGCKIYLLPHQLNTVMRCLKTTPCRYMLADEVGMGKTVECLSVLKVFLVNNSNTETAIIVPDALKEQWRGELLFKFDLAEGVNKGNNHIVLMAVSEFVRKGELDSCDFLIVDEVHKCLSNPGLFKALCDLSRNAENVLLLSATPVQQRRSEYLQLLKLLNPDKYDSIDIADFSVLIDRQDVIVKRATLALNDLTDLESVCNECIDSGEKIQENEDATDLFEEITDYLDQICDAVGDEKLTELCGNIDLKEDGGIFGLKTALSYICSNYQIESNLIRNRRALLENSEDGPRLMPVRKLIDLPYELNADQNEYETLTYRELSKWIFGDSTLLNSVEKSIRPILCAFFSSSFAFREALRNCAVECPDELIEDTNNWIYSETEIRSKIRDILDDPVQYADYYSSRPVKVLDFVFENAYSSKVVLFTNYEETFEYYRGLLTDIYQAEEFSVFSKDMEQDDLELGVYRFQNDAKCKIMLCDSTGGEGRNFQCADYVIHIDLPWDANAIEQRIGRLDRLERDAERNIVYSVVVHTMDTFEESLFKFWNDGLKIFTQSLSGMEIIMDDINREIYASFGENFQYSLAEKIPEIIAKADDMRRHIRIEQNFDAAAYMFKPLNVRIRRMVEYYNAHENELFANSMTQWASLAGMVGQSDGKGNVTYYPNNFSSRSAENSLLIPPNWNLYLTDSQTAFVNRIRNAHENKNARQEQNIRGSFIRKNAIENDYLHFFAPGDPIFDCIVDNAIHSCKGQAAAFAVLTDFDWSGFIYTWSLAPDIRLLIDHHIPALAASEYRNYISNELVITPVSFVRYGDVKDEIVIKNYRQIIISHDKKKIEHLGKRGKSFGFMNIGFDGISNIEWFKNIYCEEKWENLVKQSHKIARKKAEAQFSKKSALSACKEEMQRELSAKAAANLYYNNAYDLSRNQEELDWLYQSLAKPIIRLESAAFIIMRKSRQ